MKAVQYNKQTEFEVNEGVSPDRIVFSGLIENLPEDIINGLGGYKRLFDLLTEEDKEYVLVLR